MLKPKHPLTKRQSGRLGGRAKSQRKAEAARINGRRGGRLPAWAVPWEPDADGSAFPVRLDPETDMALREIAGRYGLNRSTLARKVIEFAYRRGAVLRLLGRDGAATGSIRLE